MKSEIILLCLLLVNVFVYSQEDIKQRLDDVENEEFGHHALLEERSFTFGLGVPYSFVHNSIGVNSRFYYNIGEQICFGPEFSYFSKDEESIYDINLVGHYVFETEILGIYPLTGVNYTIENSEHESAKSFGVVAGAGVHRSFKRIMIFAEYSHVFSKLKDDFATVGLMYHFN